MATAAKTAAVAEIRDAFNNSTAAVLTEYRGLSVAQLRELRRALAGNATYAVVKNTLTKIAARDAGVPGFDALLEGPSAIAFVSGDPVTVAKGIRDFSRTNPLLVIKGGVLDGRAMSAEEIRRLADLESREVLLARLAGGLQASLSGAVSLMAAPLAQAARVLAALHAVAAADPGVLRGGAGSPPADEAGTDPAATDPAATDPAGTDPAATDQPASGEPALTDESRTDQRPTDQPPTGDATPAELAGEPPARDPTPTDPAAEPATSGDAADAAVAADALARDVGVEPLPDAPADTPDEPATRVAEEPPA